MIKQQRDRRPGFEFNGGTSSNDWGSTIGLQQPEVRLRQTVYYCLHASAQHFESSEAVLGSGRTPLSHGGLVHQIETTVEGLNSLGVGRGNKVAIVLPNGPAAAACCLSVASGAVAAPLNPGSAPAEFAACLSDLKPDAVIVEDGSPSACVPTARGLGIPVLRLVSDPREPAGSFRLEGGTRKRADRPGFAEPDDVALMVCTSGSTSRPKMAPLTHRNVCSGAANNVLQLGLTARDRCLCITAMFYTQGVLVSVFSSLMAGGSAVCTSGYDPARFFEWLDEFSPTWYSAPTAMQRSILEHSARHPGAVSRARIRVIRCTSSPAGPDFIHQMEELFRAPMLNTYGLTETGSTIAGERLPPAARKPGSLGVAVGSEIAIVDALGRKLPPGQVGEVVARGPSIIAAYEADAAVNRQSFIDGWLRTGDLGTLDQDGYLFLTGRIKEIINRGGEKISPAEIDAVLNAHPAVMEATAFAIPEKRLDEDVAAAVVLREGVEGSEQLERELREFCATRLAPTKVPRRIVFVAETPKTPTGKIVRIGMAERLGLGPSQAKKTAPAADRDAPARAKGPRGIVEMVLLHIWEEELGQRPIGIDDNFFDLGGDSLVGARLLTRVESIFAKKLGLASLLEGFTVQRMASLVSKSRQDGYTFAGSKVIPIRSSGSLPPLVILGPHPLFRALILNLPENLPVFGLCFPEAKTLPLPYRIEDIAARQVEALRRFRPEGPYRLMGWCVDGVLAFEMAQQLRAQGQEVARVLMIDTFNPARRHYESRWASHRDRLRFHLANLGSLNGKARVQYSRERVQTLERKIRQKLWRAMYRLHLRTERRVGEPARLDDQILTMSATKYMPKPYDGLVMVVRAETRPPGTGADAAFGWRHLVRNLRVVDVPGNHRDIFTAPNVTVMASAFADVLESDGTARQAKVRAALR
jgi:oxalate---CoA ligase